MSKRPARFDQVIPTIVPHDAVSHHTFEVQRVLRSLGFRSDIYAIHPAAEVRHLVRPFDELLDDPSERWLLYQASIGSEAVDGLLASKAPLVVNYHNITPARYVERWMPALGEEVRLGRRQMAELAERTALGIGVSAYNARELEAWGYARTAVARLIIDRSNFETAPDGPALNRLRAQRRGRDWLFVGQMLPHKSHHDLVAAFAAYVAAYDAEARLHLVGRTPCEPYRLAVEKLIAELGLSAQVELTGPIPAGALAAYYEGCDVFVCCSDHEGLGAPLLEAMQRGLPVVAFEQAAVGETVGDGGVLLRGKEPALVAAAVERVLSDRELRRQLVERGRKRAACYTPGRARQELVSAIEQLFE